MIQVHVAAWVIAIVAFGLLVIEPRGWDWVAYAFGLSVLLVALTGLFAVPVALTQAVQAFRGRCYWPAIAFALLAIAALLAVSVWLYIQRQRP